MLIAFSQGDNTSPVDVSRCAIRWLARRVSERERERSVPSPLRGLPDPASLVAADQGPHHPRRRGRAGDRLPCRTIFTAVEAKTAPLRLAIERTKGGRDLASRTL